MELCSYKEDASLFGNKSDAKDSVVELLWKDYQKGRFHKTFKQKSLIYTEMFCRE